MFRTRETKNHGSLPWILGRLCRVYEGLRGFDPSVIQHAIAIKQEAKLVRQRPINPALEETLRNEVEKLLNSHIIFLTKYSEWVSNLVPIWKRMDILDYVLIFVL